MNLEQLMGRYFRLKQELAIVSQAQPWHKGRINRLADELAAVEREITALQPTTPPATSTLPRAA
jgi:hypothetical protein